MSEKPRPSIVAVRFGEADLETVEQAATIMGDRSLSSFCRSGIVAISKGIIEAHLDAGRPVGATWEACWIAGTVERKEPT